MNKIPAPNEIFPNEYKTSCFIKNVITAPNIIVGDYTYYDDALAPTEFEKNNVLFNYPEFGDKLIIGKFCSIASGTKFIMGSANHRLGSVTTYPFNVLLPHNFGDINGHPVSKGDVIIGNDVWVASDVTIMSGVRIGDGAVVANKALVTKDVPPYSIVGGVPAKVIRKRFDDETIKRLLEIQWWNWEDKHIVNAIRMLQSNRVEELIDYYYKNML